MISYCLPELSTDSLNASTTNDPHDTLIEIDDRTSNDVKNFDAHASVLRSKCEYFKVALSDKWATKIDDKYKLKLDGSSDAFEVILNGICSGKIVLNNPDTDLLMELMLISDILLLHEFIDILRSELDGKKDKNKKWCDDDIISKFKTSYRISLLQDLYSYCQEIFVERPLDVIYFPEIKIFNKLIECGIENTPGFVISIDNTFDTSRIDALKRTIKNGLRLIRYNEIKYKEYETLILKYDQIFPTSRPQYRIPRRINSPVEPKIISSRLAGLIATWIDRKDPTEEPY
ncbi:19910_t:CDS:2 [Funneliformis geosporum]|uniref:19910_t:CDS:1 n=1 Tax=Funneliformis geosporum TaxID=1117311 RepID=A0A9W4WPL7_9GLOM|nr:19910_t:CDS:2 [Funneliformis geosporum]